MREDMRRAIEGLGVDYADVRLQTRDITTVSYAGHALGEIGCEVKNGGMIRALYKGAWGTAVFSSVDDLPTKAREAARLAKLAGRDESRLAPVPAVVDHVVPKLTVNPADVPLADKVEQIRDYSEYLLGHDKIASTRLTYTDVVTHKYFASTDNTFIEQEQCQVDLWAYAVARDGNVVQEARTVIGLADGYGGIEERQDDMDELACRAKETLTAKPAPGGKMTCVLGPYITGVFIHEAFGHTDEADHIAGNPHMEEVMRIGKRFAVPELTAVDDPTMRGAANWYVYDDEGVRAERVTLVKDGILAGHMHSRETAGKMGEQATGHARAWSYEFKPVVRMSNTYIEGGDWDVDEMIKSTKQGMYLDINRGGQGGQNFTFAAGEAFLIRDGELAERVTGANLSGDVFETLMNIDAISRNVKHGYGSCGKGQPAAVTMGGPHIRVNGVTVGGRQDGR
ncbi:MAG: TldD/PmbA family protein [Chloroflexota bacterium]